MYLNISKCIHSRLMHNSFAGRQISLVQRPQNSVIVLTSRNSFWTTSFDSSLKQKLTTTRVHRLDAIVLVAIGPTNKCSFFACIVTFLQLFTVERGLSSTCRSRLKIENVKIVNNREFTWLSDVNFSRLSKAFVINCGSGW